VAVTEVVSELPLTGRVALVTGGAHAIGRACAVALARAGCAVAVQYRIRAGEADETASLCERESGRAASVQADIGRAEDVERMWVDITAALGAPTVLVHAAGTTLGRTLGETAPGEWRTALASNLDAAFYCMRAVLPAMRAAGFGRIVSLTLAPADQLSALPGHGAFAAARAALLSLTRTLAAEEVAHGITANSVGPGLTDDPDLPEDLRATMLAAAPLGRLARAEEVARVVAFLASPASGQITGTHVKVGGGWAL
jgi:3-oxoacyl-[acyl-carrier protein] reductase